MTDSRNISRREMLRSGVLGRWITELIPDDTPGVSKPSPSSPALVQPQPNHRRYPEKADDLPAGKPNRSRAVNIPILRPPGAIDEQSFLAECTRCDACLEACPHDAIIHAPQRMRDAVGTPMIDPIRQPCWMCDDRPCIAACEPRVLRHDVPYIMGTARITEETCLAYTGSFCSVCTEQCPIDGAIETVGGKPRIVEENCTGCGVCQYACPAPHNAVLLMPSFQRPTQPNEMIEHD